MTEIIVITLYLQVARSAPGGTEENGIDESARQPRRDVEEIRTDKLNTIGNAVHSSIPLGTPQPNRVHVNRDH